jgi:thiamine phosphate synthase YjbQ (UPF0047 family)
MTSVEIPYSIACALPSLVVLDITNEIGREIGRAEADDGIAYVTAGPEGLVRVNERESGFFTDLEGLLGRLVPLDVPDRGRVLSLLLGSRTEQLPFTGRSLCLGRWQRVLLFGFGEEIRTDWTLTVVG